MEITDIIQESIWLALTFIEVNVMRLQLNPCLSQLLEVVLPT